LANHPVLSIVICTYNRDKYLQKCLDHLLIQTASKNLFEVLVINNNSTDQTEQICLNYLKANPQLQFKYFIEPQQGLSFCRNRGITESQGEILSYIDDDAFADRDYASNLISYFQDHTEVDALGGKVTPLYQSKEPKWMSSYLLPLVAALDMGDTARPFSGWRFPIGANMAFRRAVLVGSGPFHTGLGRKGSFLGSGEEKELFYRLKKQNRSIHYVPSVHVQHSIHDFRLETGYIKRMARGIGKSEALRMKTEPLHLVLSKWFQEFFKIGATIILAFSYILQGKWPKAIMLVKFRMWLFGSFLKS